MGPLKCKYLSTLVSPDQVFAKEVDSVCVCVCVCVRACVRGACVRACVCVCRGGGNDLVCR